MVRLSDSGSGSGSNQTLSNLSTRYGYEYIREVKAPDGLLYHVLRKKSIRAAPVELEDDESQFQISALTRTHHHDLVKHPDVQFVEAQILRTHTKRHGFPLRRREREPPHDPMYRYQWHLEWINANMAWDAGFTGAGVQIAVVDDGLEKSHPEFTIPQNRYSAEGSYDFNHYDAEPTPDPRYDDHGTSAAGTAAASMNTHCGVGVAPEVSVAGIQMLSGAITDAQEASALSYRWDLNDIYSCSWGPSDNGENLVGPGPFARSALERATTEGRNGRGSLFVWAAGNGALSGDDCNFDGYANSRFVATIGALDDHHVRSRYAESCAAMLAVAPSSGGSERIITADLSGRAGASSTECRTNFGGTSAACPMVAGAYALLLQARPELTWRDVHHATVRSCDTSTRIRDGGADSFKRNGGGRMFSHDYGFGLVDVERLIEVGTSMDLVAEEVSEVVSFGGGGSSSSFINYTAPYEVEVSAQILVESVDLYVSLGVTSMRGALEISLESPSGFVAHLHPLHGDRHVGSFEWRFNAVCFWDEHSDGVWKLHVTSVTNPRSTVDAPFRLVLHGTAAAAAAAAVPF